MPLLGSYRGQSETHPHRALGHACRNASRGEGADDEDDDGEEVNRWNLRKCSAAGLDVLSTVFGDELLPIVLPIVEQKLRVRFYSTQCSANCDSVPGVRLNVVRIDSFQQLGIHQRAYCARSPVQGSRAVHCLSLKSACIGAGRGLASQGERHPGTRRNLGGLRERLAQPSDRDGAAPFSPQCHAVHIALAMLNAPASAQ